MTRALLHMFRLTIVLAAFMALGAVGFAHKHAPLNFTPDLVGYLQLGGALSDICGDVDGKGHGASETCEACRIADSAFGAGDVQSSALALPRSADLSACEAFAALGATHPSFAARAPPVLI